MRYYHSRADVREWLRGVFERRANGRDRACTMADLRTLPDCPLACDGSRARVGTREIREAIADLVEYDHLPVVSGRRGYYLAAEAEDLRLGARELHVRAMALLVRKRELLTQGAHRLGQQMPLDLVKAECLTDSALSVLNAEG